MFGNHTNLFCHAVKVGNENVKKVVWESASACFTWDITWTLCNACNPTFYWPVRCTPCSCRVCLMPGAHSTEQVLFKLIVQFFRKGVVFMFWQDIVYIELLYCVTNFELVWTWNKVAVVENAKPFDCTPPSPILNAVIKKLYNFLKHEKPVKECFDIQARGSQTH